MKWQPLMSFWYYTIMEYGPNSNWRQNWILFIGGNNFAINGVLTLKVYLNRIHSLKPIRSLSCRKQQNKKMKKIKPIATTQSFSFFVVVHLACQVRDIFWKHFRTVRLNTTFKIKEERIFWRGGGGGGNAYVFWSSHRFRGFLVLRTHGCNHQIT